MNQTAFAVVLAMWSVGCQSRQIDDTLIVDPGNDVSFAADIQPLFNQSCGGTGCHVGSTTNGVDLQSHASVLASSGLQYGSAIVLTGNGAGSPLIDKLGASPQFGQRMPLGRGALSGQDIATIRQWIDDGAPNN